MFTLTYNRIISEIESIIAGNYSSWTIGVTDDPNRRRSEHGSPFTWYQWNPLTESEARSIENYFLSKGCHGGSGGLGYANVVYIFKHY